MQPLITSKTDVICLRQIYLTEQELHELEEEKQKKGTASSGIQKTKKTGSNTKKILPA